MSENTSLALWMVDAGLTYFINSFSGRSDIADMAMQAISLAGIPVMVVAVATLWWSHRNRAQARFVALSAGLSFFLALALNQVILLMVQRVRPYDAGVTHLVVAPSLDPSFPSDHASAAFAVAFACLLHGRTKFGSVLAVCAALVAVSRVYVGTHYVGDIVGGALTALVAATIVMLFYRQESWVNRRLSALL